MKVFFPIRGISVDAVALENWLQQNPCTAPPVPGYTIYMLNLSHLDSSDGSKDHWFDPGMRDPDSKRPIQWLGYGVGVELYLDLPVYPAYAGWGNASRLFFLDPSAHQWYLKWTAVWGDGRTWDLPYGHDLTGLAEFVRDRDIYGADGRAALSRYLARWIDELADGLVRRDHGIHRFYRDTLVDVLVLNGAQGSGVTNEELAWTTSREALSPVMTDIAPFMEWGFNIRVRDIESYPRLKQAVLESSTRVDGKLHVVASDVWSFLVGETASMFDLGAADRVIACLIVVMNDTIMVREGPEGKEAVWGIGIGGRVLVMMEPSGFYFPGNETRRIGLTSVLVHELGHNLGLGHMHLSSTRATHSAEFTGDVMGYLLQSGHFSKFMKDSFQRNTFDSIYVQVMRDITQIEDTGKREIVQGLMEQAVLLYDNMSYLDALYRLRETQRIISGEVTVVATAITVTRVQTLTSQKTLTHTLTATVTTTATRGAVDPGIVVLLLVLLLTVASALTIISIGSQRSIKR